MNKWKLLIVEDDMDMHEVTKLTLKRFEYMGQRLEFLNAMSAEEAKVILSEEEDIAVILLDVVMETDHAGLELVRYIREDLDDHRVQIILRTGQPGQAPEGDVILKYEINDYQEKSELTNQKLKTSIITALRSYNTMLQLEAQKNELTRLNFELEEAQEEVFYILGEIAESRTPTSGNHVKRVGAIVEFLCQRAGVLDEDIPHIKSASMLHDIGKLAIPEAVLNKPGKLDAHEFDIMKSHSVAGYKMLRNSTKDQLRIASVIAKEHHENYDGSGYPDGLSGEDITLISRIVSIADVFDALGTKRVYKDAWSYEDITQYMMEQTGTKFDPKLMTIFDEHIDELIAIREKYPD